MESEAQAATAGECLAAGDLGGACAEEQVERAEEDLALDMRTELLQQEAKRFRAAALAEKPNVREPLASVVDASGSGRQGRGRHGQAGARGRTAAEAPAYNATEVAKLVHAEQNLSDVVHRQAEVVAQSTDELSRALAKVKNTAQHSAAMERRFNAARAKAEAAQQGLQGFLLALGNLKKRRDNLQSETAMVQQQLDKITQQYTDVEREYKDLLSRLPDQQGSNSSAEEATRAAAKQLQEANGVEGAAKASMRNESADLQLAIQKLNTLNAELRTIEGRIQEAYAQMESAATGSHWSPLLLLAASASAAVRLRA